jgi:hypothetical protein
VPPPAIRHEIHEAFMTSPPPPSAGDTSSADHLLGLISAQIRPARRVNTQVNELHAVRACDGVTSRVLAAGLADEVQLVIAPFFVGDPDAPRFVGAAAFPWDSGHPMTLAEARPIGDVVLLRYLLTERATGEQQAAG